MPQFVGRAVELARLRDELTRVRPGEGRLLVVRGRRQVGKSTLLERFTAEADTPAAFFAAAAGADPGAELAAFVDEVAASNLEAAVSFADSRPVSWAAAFRALARATTRPSLLVLDEFLYLVAQDPAIEGVMQREWDRHLSRAPLLVVLIGSNVSVMAMLTEHGRPLFGRAGELLLAALTPADLADLLDLDAAAAFDATLVTGGLPRLAHEWQATGAPSATGFVRGQLADSTSPLVVLGERYLSAEFPTQVQAADVLQVIGAGESTFGRVAERAGISHGSLTRSLRTLEDARLVVADRPLSAAPSRLVRYRVREPYLRFWLRFVGPERERILRGRGDVVADRVDSSWSDYRGVAVEPVVSEAVLRLLPDDRLGPSAELGRYWTRDQRVEVDLVVADRPTAPAAIAALGSVEWRERAAFDRRDASALHRARALVPGAAEAKLLAVSRSGGEPADVDLLLSPRELLDSWR